MLQNVYDYVQARELNELNSRPLIFKLPRIGFRLKSIHLLLSLVHQQTFSDGFSREDNYQADTLTVSIPARVDE